MEVIMGKIGKYFSGVKKELSRVRWTDKKNLLKYSIATVCFVVFFGIFFYVIDYVIAWIRTI
jgi:preprotein translocase SecE subunit